MNPFGHLDLRVTSLAAAEPFYAALLPALGFAKTYHGGAWRAWANETPLPAAAYMAVTEDPDHRPNANRLAFWVADRESVDRLAAIARDHGALNWETPELMPYGPSYYATYFEDPSGNRLEIYCREQG